MRVLVCAGALLTLSACVSNSTGTMPASSPVTVTASRQEDDLFLTEPQFRARAGTSGQAQLVDYFYALNPDCTARGYPVVRIVQPPLNGQLISAQTEDYTTYPSSNERFSCNKKKSPVTALHYIANPGYNGPDMATVEVVFPLGTPRTIQYAFDVR